MSDWNPVEEQLRQATQAFNDANGAREAGLSDAVVVNRLYYRERALSSRLGSNRH